MYTIAWFFFRFFHFFQQHFISQRLKRVNRIFAMTKPIDCSIYFKAISIHELYFFASRTHKFHLRHNFIQPYRSNFTYFFSFNLTIRFHNTLEQKSNKWHLKCDYCFVFIVHNMCGQFY